jgi:hypothetical protein
MDKIFCICIKYMQLLNLHCKMTGDPSDPFSVRIELRKLWVQCMINLFQGKLAWGNKTFWSLSKGKYP